MFFLTVTYRKLNVELNLKANIFEYLELYLQVFLGSFENFDTTLNERTE
jgi:hypothetical protein